MHLVWPQRTPHPTIPKETKWSKVSTETYFRYCHRKLTTKQIWTDIPLGLFAYCSATPPSIHRILFICTLVWTMALEVWHSTAIWLSLEFMPILVFYVFQDLVETHLVQGAHRQKVQYMIQLHAKSRHIHMGDMCSAVLSHSWLIGSLVGGG